MNIYMHNHYIKFFLIIVKIWLTLTLWYLSQRSRYEKKRKGLISSFRSSVSPMLINFLSRWWSSIEILRAVSQIQLRQTKWTITRKKCNFMSTFKHQKPKPCNKRRKGTFLPWKEQTIRPRVRSNGSCQIWTVTKTQSVATLIAASQAFQNLSSKQLPSSGSENSDIKIVEFKYGKFVIFRENTWKSY